MIKDVVKAIRQVYSGQAAKDDVASIIRPRRIQASPGYRDAAEYVWHELQKSGLEAHIETFPANHQTAFWEVLWISAPVENRISAPASQNGVIR